jgi:hypothetical protein
MYIYEYCQRRPDGSGYVETILHSNKFTQDEFIKLIEKHESKIDWSTRIEKRIHKVIKKLIFFNGFETTKLSTSELEYGQYFESLVKKD